MQSAECRLQTADCRLHSALCTQHSALSTQHSALGKGGGSPRSQPGNQPDPYPPICEFQLKLPLTYPNPKPTHVYITQSMVFLSIYPTIYLQGPWVVLGPRAGNNCGVSWITRVLHLGSRLWPANGTPARGGVRVRPTLAKVGRAKRSFSTGF